MSDARLRELERRWRESGSTEDEAAYLRERVRVGDLTQERLELAAYCGNAASIAALSKPVRRSEEVHAWIRDRIGSSVSELSADTLGLVLGLESWGDTVLVRGLIAISEQAMLRDSDKRLVEAARAWCECPCAQHGTEMDESLPRDVPLATSLPIALGAFVSQSALGNERGQRRGSLRSLAVFALRAATGAHSLSESILSETMKASLIAWALTSEGRSSRATGK